MIIKVKQKKKVEINDVKYTYFYFPNTIKHLQPSPLTSSGKYFNVCRKGSINKWKTTRIDFNLHHF